MSLVLRCLDFVGRRAPMALVVGIVLSLAVPFLSRIASPFFPAIVVGTLTLAFARIDLARAVGLWRRSDLIVLALVFLLVAMPVAVAFTAPYLGLSPPLLVALVLLAASPPLASGAGFAFLLGLDAEFSVNLVLAGTLAMPFIAPPLVFHALDLGLDVDVWSVFVRLAVAVGAAVVLAAIVRFVAGRERILRHGTAFDGAAALWMILFLIAIMDGIPALIAEQPGRVLALFILGVAANFGFQLALLAATVMPSRRRGAAAAGGLATLAMFAGNRNLGLVLTALPPALAVEFAPFVALYQIPIYLTPLVMGPVFRRYVGPRPAAS